MSSVIQSDKVSVGPYSETQKTKDTFTSLLSSIVRLSFDSILNVCVAFLRQNFCTDCI